MFIRLVRNLNNSRTAWQHPVHYSVAITTSTSCSSHRQVRQHDQQRINHAERRRQASTSTTSSTQQTFHTKNGRVKIDLSKPQLVGVHQSRGERPYQEDRHAVQAVMLDRGEVDRAIDTLGGQGRLKSASAPSPSSAPSSSSSAPAAGGDPPTKDASLSPTAQEQALYVAVFDGHNGHSVSHFLSEHLHSRIVEYPRSQVNETVTAYRGLGGYLRRYRAGILQDLVEQPAPAGRSRAVPVQRRNRGGTSDADAKNGPSVAAEDNAAADKAKKEKAKLEAKPWNLHQRLHASFLDADLEIIENDKEYVSLHLTYFSHHPHTHSDPSYPSPTLSRSGSVATIAILHSLDEPRNPFFNSEKLHLIIAHLGDTRALLCTAPEGEAVILTEKHHPEARSETDRLMRTRTGAVTDSFGEVGLCLFPRRQSSANYASLHPPLVPVSCLSSRYSCLLPRAHLARFVQTRFARALRSLPSISLRLPILRSFRSLLSHSLRSRC